MALTDELPRMLTSPALYSLVYRSHASRALHEVTLTTLLRKARLHNQSAQLSGLLLFAQSQFLQVLEGPEPALSELYARIRADPRHFEVRTLAYGPIERRVFPDWRMAYAPVDRSVLEGATGFMSLSAAPGLTAHPPEGLALLLRDFAQGRAQDG